MKGSCMNSILALGKGVVNSAFFSRGILVVFVISVLALFQNFGDSSESVLFEVDNGDYDQSGGYQFNNEQAYLGYRGWIDCPVGYAITSASVEKNTGSNKNLRWIRCERVSGLTGPVVAKELNHSFSIRDVVGTQKCETKCSDRQIREFSVNCGWQSVQKFDQPYPNSWSEGPMNTCIAKRYHDNRTNFSCMKILSEYPVGYNYHYCSLKTRDPKLLDDKLIQGPAFANGENNCPAGMAMVGVFKRRWRVTDKQVTIIKCQKIRGMLTAKTSLTLSDNNWAYCPVSSVATGLGTVDEGKADSSGIDTSSFEFAASAFYASGLSWAGLAMQLGQLVTYIFSKPGETPDVYDYTERALKCTSVGSVPNVATNLLSNGDFESQSISNNWTTSSGAQVDFACGNKSYSGTKCASLNFTSLKGTYSTVEQPVKINVSALKKYRLEIAYLTYHPIRVRGHAYVEVQWLNSQGTLVASKKIMTSGNTKGNWRIKKASLKVPEGATNAKVSLIAGNGLGLVRFDAIDLFEIP